MTDDGDLDFDAEMADAVLRDILGNVAESPDDPKRAELIEVVMATAWPDGTPPTAEELASEPDFAAMMEIAGGTDDAVDDADDDFDSPDTFDTPEDDVNDDDADGWGDGDDADAPGGEDDPG